VQSAIAPALIATVADINASVVFSYAFSAIPAAVAIAVLVTSRKVQLVNFF
jgi:orotate phosphoribosyltransferase